MTHSPTDIVKALVAKHRDRTDLHITRVMGVWIAVSNGEIVDMDRTHALRCCPLQRLLSKAGIEEYVYEKMRKFGHFSAGREIERPSIAVPFGTSEMLMFALRKAVIDCAVVVCDGAGTVASDNPDIVQGIGARMNGLFHTTPIAAIQTKLRAAGCLVFDDAAIDQARGVEAAANAGYRRIAVTINTCVGESFEQIRQLERTLNVELTIVALCATAAGGARAEDAARHSDLTWSCASKHIRECGKTAIMQITEGIPIFVFTRRGVDIVAAYSDREGAAILQSLDPRKHYLLSSSPPRAGLGPDPKHARLVLGGRTVCLAESELPVAGRHAPEPLT